jgi:hypothetical protein
VRARGAGEEWGFTVVEAVVAAFILAIGVLGVLQLADAGARNTFRATQSQVVVNRLQAEMEAIKQLPFDKIALTSAPTTSSDPEHPASRASEGHFALDRDGNETGPLVVDAAGDVEPVSDFASGDVSGQIHRFVVWVNDDACPEALCPGEEDLKRIVVAATIDETASGGTRAYQELQSEVVDPNVTPVDDPVPPGEQPVTYPGTFWLTDSSCQESERQPIIGSHLTHNTFGRCADGTQTESTRGSPDLMFTQQPPEDEDNELPTLYDYSTDVGANDPDEGGLQILPPDGLVSGDCLLESLPLTSTQRPLEQHLWLSPPLPSSVLLLNQATLELWVKSPPGGSYSGRICVHLFKRTLSADLTPTDTAVVNEDLAPLTYFLYPRPPQESLNPWPSEWTEISLPMRFASLGLEPNERLGLAISIKPDGTDAPYLEFAYDHPSFESRLEVQSEAPLPF